MTVDSENTPSSEGEPEVAVVIQSRKLAHYHAPDKRAQQQGPIQGTEPVIGRQTREPCYEAIYNVRNPNGLKINERLYRGRVVVPECVANTLNTLDSDWESIERNLFRNSPINREYAV